MGRNRVSNHRDSRGGSKHGRLKWICCSKMILRGNAHMSSPRAELISAGSSHAAPLQQELGWNCGSSAIVITLICYSVAFVYIYNDSSGFVLYQNVLNNLRSYGRKWRLLSWCCVSISSTFVNAPRRQSISSCNPFWTLLGVSRRFVTIFVFMYR